MIDMTTTCSCELCQPNLWFGRSEEVQEKRQAVPNNEDRLEEVHQQKVEAARQELALAV